MTASGHQPDDDAAPATPENAGDSAATPGRGAIGDNHMPEDLREVERDKGQAATAEVEADAERAAAEREAESGPEEPEQAEPDRSGAETPPSG